MFINILMNRYNVYQSGYKILILHTISANNIKFVFDQL